MKRPRIWGARSFFWRSGKLKFYIFHFSRHKAVSNGVALIGLKNCFNTIYDHCGRVRSSDTTHATPLSRSFA